MARESQSLQIALIIFVILTIVLGVFTYVFCRQYIEQRDRADASDEVLGKGIAAWNQANQELGLNETRDRGWLRENLPGLLTTAAHSERLKEIMGFKPEDELKPTIEDQFDKDKKEYAAGYAEVSKAYRPLMIHLHDLVNKKNSELTDLTDDLQALQAKYDQWQKDAELQIQDHENNRKAAEKKLADAVAAFNATLDQIRTGKDKIQKDWEDDRKTYDTEVTTLKADLKKADADLTTERAIKEMQAEEIARFAATTVETPDGEITAVDQRSGTVWINRGRADSLRDQTTFSVYPADITNLAKAGRKATIEVTRIRDEHLAEARITEDAIADPIMRGDKIYTPVWTPGEQVGFALVGLMDIDGDGKSDRQVVRQLIEMQGGRVDYEMDEKEQVLGGKMKISTRYVVVDAEAKELEEQPENAKAKAGAGGQGTPYSKAMEEARQLGIKKITIGDLLRQMGWKKPTHVVEFGRGANPKDFQPKPPEGVPRTSTGNVSDLFRQRRPPARKPAARGGAY